MIMFDCKNSSPKKNMKRTYNLTSIVLNFFSYCMMAQHQLGSISQLGGVSLLGSVSHLRSIFQLLGVSQSINVSQLGSSAVIIAFSLSSYHFDSVICPNQYQQSTPLALTVIDIQLYLWWTVKMDIHNKCSTDIPSKC